jgi:hypothetical protein
MAPPPADTATLVPHGPRAAEQETDMTDPSNASDTQAETPPPRPQRIDIRHLTVEQLAGLGVSQIAYVKPVMMNGTMAFAIHAADGTPMAMADDRDLAVAAIHQHEMLATLVH